MRRKLFTLATAVSAVLCVAVCVLWVRSVSGGDAWHKPNRRGMGDVLWSFKGVLAIERWDDFGHGPRHSTGPWERHRSPPTASPLVFAPGARWWNRLGFSAGALGHPTSEQQLVRWLAAPHWAIAALTTLLPGARVVRGAVRRPRALGGHCPACGYDLRATPDRCPECGRPARAPAAV